MSTWHDVEQGSPAWHELRKNKWTGSKAINLLQGKPVPYEYDFQGNRHTKRGHALELVAIREYERITGRKVERPGFVTNKLYPNAGYSPDGVDRWTLLEVKALNGEKHDKLAAGEIPLIYLAQIFFGMVITGCRRAKLLAFNPECEQQLTIINIKYDKTIINNIREKLRLDLEKRQT